VNCQSSSQGLQWTWAGRATRIAELNCRISESVGVLESLFAELKEWLKDYERRSERLTVLESRFAELERHIEEKDRRWWQFWVGVGIVGFTFIANLTIQLILLYSRKTG
jgi:uncharacterized coiled-coil protein SlyX